MEKFGLDKEGKKYERLKSRKQEIGSKNFTINNLLFFLNQV